MEVKLTNIKGTWKEVVNRARTTVGKEELGKEPSDKFKRKILMAEHSPIRGLIYCFKITNIKSWVATHFVRHHVGVEKWVRTQRTDRTGISRDELPQGAEVEMEIEANAQALINISRKRLCNQASPETREVMQEIKKEVSKRDEFLANVMVKECIYRGFCPEINSCNYDKTEKFKKELEDYRNTIR
ncbi:MAG: FAD-dependent thymidylate synthase [Clostridium sp.]|nr:FAD-dependent thymidylate synthase [Clostridium sp.]